MSELSPLESAILRNRCSQLLINERYKQKRFTVPIHLALGHEAIAEALCHALEAGDQLVLPHRNLHYQLALKAPVEALCNEYQGLPSGLAGGRRGSMNLTWPQQGQVYTSSILGNNLSVACGLALGQKVRGLGQLVVVVTGDGAIEEGAFYESLLFCKSHALRMLILVENNDCSLATTIAERRCPIDLAAFAQAFDLPYFRLEGNQGPEYLAALTDCRRQMLERPGPVCLEVMLSTLGDYTLITPDYPHGKWINYHAGPAPKVELSQGALLVDDARDPLYWLIQVHGAATISAAATLLADELEAACALS